MKPNSVLIFAGLAILAIVIIGFFTFKGTTGTNNPNKQSFSTNSPNPQRSEDIKVGTQAPNFNLQTFDNQSISLANFKGKAVFVDFWAAWCPFCVEELPQIEKISQEFKDDLVVLGIHRTETESVENGAKFAKDKGVTYPLLKDSDGSIYKAYTGGRNFMPTAAFINKEGKVIKVLYGPKTEEQMRQYVKEALGQTN